MQQNIIYYQISKDQHTMASIQAKSQYTRHSPYSREATEAPLRSKVFSQIDNLTHQHTKSSKHQLEKTPQSNDKIAQIKKKYEKLLNKNTNTPNKQFQCPSRQYNRSNYKTGEFKYDNVNRPYGVSEEVQRIYSRAGQNSVTPKKGENVWRDNNGAKNEDMKSKLQSNRSTLTAMKSELQAKLNQLSSKTIMSSALRKNIEDTTPKKPENISKEENYSPYSKQINPIPSKYLQEQSKSYQKIAQKYSKMTRTHQQPKHCKNDENKMMRNQQKSKDYLPQSYLKRYANTSSNSIAEKNRAMKQQLSIISEKSNSNKSQSFNHLDLDQKSRKESAVQASDVREIVDPQYDQLFIRPQQQKKETQTLQQDTKWYKNSYSYLDSNQTKPYLESRHHLSDNEVDKGKNQRQNILENLENNVGPIKRTTTQQHFMGYNKAARIAAVNDPKEIMTNNFVNTTTPKEKISSQPLKYSISHLQTDLKEATFGKKAQKEGTTKVYEVSNPTPQQNQPGNSQIDRFKQKYSRQPSSNASNSQNIHRQPQKKVWQAYQFKDNKDICSKIDRIDQRIKEIESNKKNLNISFKPYQARSTSKYAEDEIKTTNEQTYKDTLLNKYTPKHTDPSSKYTETSVKYSKPIRLEDNIPCRPRIASYMDRVKPLYSEATIKAASKTHDNGFAIRLIPVEVQNEESQPRDRSISSVSIKTSKQWKNKMELESRTGNGIEERKKKLQQKFEANNTIRQLVNLLSQQAVIDQLFRNNKIWFASANIDKKWSQLKNQLAAHSLPFNETDLKEEFELLESENNPFFSVSDSKCDIKLLAKSYAQAQRHWKQKLSKQFNRQKLQKEGFVASKLDLDKKGYILIQDLVRFLNIESGNFLRNRDVSIIFRRINKKNEKANFEDIICAFSY